MLDVQPKSSGLPILAGQPTDPKTILGQYLQGENSTQIAARLGITRQALSQWLLHHSESDWKAAQHVMAEERRNHAIDELNEAREDMKKCENPDLAPLYSARIRACEAAMRAAEWDLARIVRRLYGDDAPPNAASVQINIGIERTSGSGSGVTIEAKPAE